MTRVDLDELLRGLRLPEPQLHGDAGALLVTLAEVFDAFDGLTTELLLETLAELGYRLDAADPADALEETLRDVLGLELRGTVWRRAREHAELSAGGLS